MEEVQSCWFPTWFEQLRIEQHIIYIRTRAVSWESSFRRSTRHSGKKIILFACVEVDLARLLPPAPEMIVFFLGNSKILKLFGLFYNFKSCYLASRKTFAREEKYKSGWRRRRRNETRKHILLSPRPWELLKRIVQSKWMSRVSNFNPTNWCTSTESSVPLFPLLLFPLLMFSFLPCLLADCVMQFHQPAWTAPQD